MSKEIIINVTGEHSRIAIVEDGELVELYIENPENVRTIGDIYLARVRRILPGIKAAFVDIGQKQDAFLHFSDLSDNLPDLLELSEGKMPDWSTKSLPKAPKLDEASGSDLELETPEEQRAARRRRDLNRATKSRRGRGKKQEEAKPEASPEPQAQQDQPRAEQEKSGGRRAKNERSEGRSRGRRVEPDPQSRHIQPTPPEPPVSSELPDRPPQILPPDAVAPPPYERASNGEPATEPAADIRPEADEQPERPKKRRGRRGGRGRNRERTQQEDERAQQEETQHADEQQPAMEQAEQEEAKPSRGRGNRSRGKKSDESTNATQAAEAPAAQDTPHDNGEPHDDDSARRSGSARQGARPSRQPKAERSVEVKTDEPKPREKQAASTPSRSSRFVIDLTSKPSRVSRDDAEEEEEEEEKGSSRGRRRGGRRRSGRGRSTPDAKKSSDSSGSDNGDSDDSDSTTSSRGDGSSRGSSRDSSSNRGGGSGRGRGSRSSSNGSSGNGYGRPEKYLKQDQKLIVKITKEPISAKGPRVSTDVSLAGRFLVLIPQADYVAVSKKIESAKERRRLRALARSLLPEGFGLIVRTVAENRDAKALDTDLRLLLEKWRTIEDQLKQKPNAPKALYADVNMVSSIIRDLFSEDYDRIVVDDPKVHKHVKNYVQAVAPQMAPLVMLHKSKEHVFRTYKIERDVRAAFETRVPLPGGGYLFIEHTEAMHVVDVNSGRAGRGLSQEENSLRVNLEAAKEVTKQLRLRDLGGIICVDFIDMRSHSARQKVYDELKKQFRKDRAVTKLLPMSDFGVVEITRQRLRPSITTTTNVDDLPPLEDLPEPEPRQADMLATESFAVTTEPALTATEVVAKLERWLATYRTEVQDQHRKRPILVRVHPFLAAYLDRGIPSTLTRWRFRTRLKFRLDVDEAASPLAFAVLDEKSGKNLTRKYDK